MHRMREREHTRVRLSTSSILTSESRSLVNQLVQDQSTNRSSVLSIIRRAISSEELKGSLPSASQSAFDLLRILGASRCLQSLPWRESTVSNVADLTKLNRNVVSDFTRSMELVGLFEKKQVGRSEVIVPTHLGDLYSDIVMGKPNIIREVLKQVGLKISLSEVTEGVMQTLEQLETAFDLAKQLHPKNSLNYEVIDGFHDSMVVLTAVTRQGRLDEAKSILKDLQDGLEGMAEAKEKAEKANLSPLLLEDTGERLGRGRVFRPVRRKS